MKFKPSPAEQFADEVVLSLIHPLHLLTGDTLAAIEQATAIACTRIVDNADTVDDIRAAADAALILDVLFPTSQPGRTWWRTPLGRLTAARGLPAAREHGISQTDAAEILNVHPGTVATLASRGTIPKAVDGGGLSLAAVLARMTRLSGDGNGMSAYSRDDYEADKTRFIEIAVDAHRDARAELDRPDADEPPPTREQTEHDDYLEQLDGDEPDPIDPEAML